jgi:hypothetical protein
MFSTITTDGFSMETNKFVRCGRKCKEIKSVNAQHRNVNVEQNMGTRDVNPK